MSANTSDLTSLLLRISKGRAEVTLPELFDVFALNPGSPILDKVLHTEKLLAEYGLMLLPGFDKGELTEIRCIDFASPPNLTVEAVKQEIARPESEKLEFKSSLFFDHQKAQHSPGLSAPELRSEGVTHTALKTIAAFLTTGGGILYIGVSDVGGVVGIQHDLACLKATKEWDSDAWQLALRDLLKTRFKDGSSISQYVECSFCRMPEGMISRIKVSARTALSFLKNKDSWQLFRRDGNRTIEVTIDQVEEFLSWRK